MKSFSEFIKSPEASSGFEGDVLYGSTGDAVAIKNSFEVQPHTHAYYIDKNSGLGRTTKGGLDGHVHLINGEVVDGVGDHYHKLNDPIAVCRTFGEFDDEASGIKLV